MHTAALSSIGIDIDVIMAVTLLNDRK